MLCRLKSIIKSSFLSLVLFTNFTFLYAADSFNPSLTDEQVSELLQLRLQQMPGSNFKAKAKNLLEAPAEKKRLCVYSTIAEIGENAKAVDFILLADAFSQLSPSEHPVAHQKINLFLFDLPAATGLTKARILRVLKDMPAKDTEELFQKVSFLIKPCVKSHDIPFLMKTANQYTPPLLETLALTLSPKTIKSVDEIASILATYPPYLLPHTHKLISQFLDQDTTEDDARLCLKWIKNLDPQKINSTYDLFQSLFRAGMNFKDKLHISGCFSILTFNESFELKEIFLRLIPAGSRLESIKNFYEIVEYISFKKRLLLLKAMQMLLEEDTPLEEVVLLINTLNMVRCEDIEKVIGECLKSMATQNLSISRKAGEISNFIQDYLVEHEIEEL